MIAAVILAGCSTPSFMRRTPEPAASSVGEPVVFEVTPRELLTARLVNRPANDNVPPITVGKLIEFADRDKLRAPQDGETHLVIDVKNFTHPQRLSSLYQ